MTRFDGTRCGLHFKLNQSCSCDHHCTGCRNVYGPLRHDCCTCCRTITPTGVSS